jgi:Neuraminidase (sialidase)
MRIRRTSVVVFTTLTAVAVALAACTSDAADDRVRPRAPVEVDDGLAEELEEQSEKTEQRLEALEAAREAGTLGVIERIVRAPAPGWAGERLLNPTGDDWEPAIATDPLRPFVYVLHNRYGGEPACRRRCPDPAMILHVSRDGGRSWRPERYLCECRGVKGQYDPLLEVVPDSGDVYAVWMNDFKIHFSRSGDRGRTWSGPVPIHREVSWGDKPNMTVSDDGEDVYVVFNGPTGGDVYASVSHDAGATWTAARLTTSERYHYDYSGAVLPDGRVVFSQISFDYVGGGGVANNPIQIHVLASDDAGATWDDLVVDELAVGSECSSQGCYEDYYDSGPVLAKDEGGDLVIVYNGAAEPLGPRTVYARSSTDGGRTWSERVRISRVGVNAAFPAVVGEGDDGARLWFMDQRTGRWNVWYTTSSDLGATWSRPVRISDARSGTAYKNRRGFAEVYGDYGEIGITSAGRTVAVWGEGISYRGPGGVWFNRER